MAKEADQREEEYRERGLGIGDLVKRRHEAGTKLHPRWDGPFRIRDVTEQRYFPPSGSQNSLWFASSNLQQKDAAALRRKEQQIQVSETSDNH